jgi:Flp pilus assembly pilin Flp
MRNMLSTIQTWTETIVRSEDGQGLTEYALILFFVSIVAVLALTFLGTQITSLLSNAANSV